MLRKTTYRLILGLSAATLAVSAVPGSAHHVAAAGWQAPVLVSATQANRETSLVVHPQNPDEVFLCDPSGVPAVFDNQSYFHRTTNGGATWSPVRVETLATDTRQYTFEGGDCDVAYDAGGTLWSADTWLGNLSIGHSADGVNWQGTALATTAPVVDRPWIVGGPPGTLYVTYQDLQCCSPSAMWFTKTTDYGATFSPAVPITTFASADGPYTWEGNFVVANGGNDIYLVYSRRLQSGAGVVVNGLPAVISLASSHDGGATWASTDIARIPRETSSIYPSIGMDAGGYLHVAWAAPRASDNPIFYTSSSDGGSTWSSVVTLVNGKTGQAPWVAGGPAAGQAAIAWLGSPDAVAGPFSDWYFYVAKVNGSSVSVATTTTDPVWTGEQVVPEFEAVRYDKNGKLHLGMSVFQAPNQWAVFYQRET